MTRGVALFCAGLLASSSAIVAQAAQRESGTACANDAIAQARKLLTYHFGEDDRISIDDKATPLPSILNPANRRQRFDVLEVWGFIYKGQYRMRFIYYKPDAGDCVLMGEEILQYATL